MYKPPALVHERRLNSTGLTDDVMELTTLRARMYSAHASIEVALAAPWKAPRRQQCAGDVCGELLRDGAGPDVASSSLKFTSENQQTHIRKTALIPGTENGLEFSPTGHIVA